MEAPLPSGPRDPIVQEVLDRLLRAYREHFPEASPNRLVAAFEVAERAHLDQWRQDGKPYITHPTEVAIICIELRLDEDGIIAALLHDVLEDTEFTPEFLRDQFGADVLQLVEGVTKLARHTPGSPEASTATSDSTRASDNLRKMLLAVARDIRVMVIKLADRLHNMRTLDAMPDHKQTRIANETLNIYAPLAARLGIWQLKWQLEDLAFKVLHPKEFREISENVAKSRSERESELKEAIELLQKSLAERGLKNVQVVGRPKHLYSIYNKVVKQGVPFQQIFDLIAVRIIVESEDDCYRALGYTHALLLPMQGLFSDYIATPKPNGYQSLHTKVIGPSGDPIEVQIRTRDMHEIAEFGVAAHWTYKEGTKKVSQTETLEDLRRQLFDWSTDSVTSSDFLRAVSVDLFSEQVFVFTPKGDVLDMPINSTPIDFAFRVHSDLGLRVVGAKINGIIREINTRLQNGDVVELITRRDATPSLDWLEFVASQHAKAKIRAYFRRQNKGDNATRGKDAVAAEIKRQGLDPRALTGDDAIKSVLKHFKDVDSPLDLFARVGEGLVSVSSVVDRLRGIVRTSGPAPAIKVGASKATTTIRTSDANVLVRRSPCCQPVPGDDVVGYVSRGRGILIHRRMCTNAISLMDREPERITPVEWEADDSLLGVDLTIVSVNRQGLLADLGTILGESRTNVSKMLVSTSQRNSAEIRITVDVRDLSHLQNVMNAMSNLTDVITILRDPGRGRS